MNRRDLLGRLLVGATALPAVGCGTILHQERIDQPHSRDIDWKIAALDGLGLAFFFVPGVIAFVVDFYTGAIYLPPRGYAASQLQNVTPRDSGSPPPDWERREVAAAQLMTPSAIEQVVTEESGERIVLAEAGTRVSRLHDWKSCLRQLGRHESNRSFGVPLDEFFGKLGVNV